MSNYTNSLKPHRFCNECAALVSNPVAPSCLVHGMLGSRPMVLDGVDGVVHEPVRKVACKTRYRNAEEVGKAVESKKGTR